MSARVNGIHSSITEAEIQEAIRQGYHFEERLHRARKEARSVRRTIPWSEVKPHDVLSGRGSDATKHPGNINFRKRCEFYSEEYFRTPISRLDQRAIRHKIVDEVLSTGGRFLEPCSPGRNHWKNIIGDNKKLREKIQNRMRGCKDRPPTAADTEGGVCPTSAMDNLDRNHHLDLYKLVLDTFGVNEAYAVSDLNDADSDDDHLSTVADIVVDISATSAMENLDTNRHLDQDKLILDISDANEANWDYERPQTVANTEGDNLDRNRYLDQDKLYLDTSDAHEAIVNLELDEADSDDDHPSTVADIVVDVSPTSTMVNLDRNHHLDEDKLFLDTFGVNEAYVTSDLNDDDSDDDHPSTVAGIVVDVIPTSTMVNLDRNCFLDQCKLFLDTFGVNEAYVTSDLNDDDSDDDHPSTVADIVVDISPTSMMENLDRNHHLDEDKFVLDTSAVNKARWDNERLQTVANTEDKNFPTSAIDNLDRNRCLDQDKLFLDSSDAYEAIDYFELDEAASDDDHPSTVADIVVDVSLVTAIVNLERNRHLDQDKLFLDTSDANEANVDFEFDEADLSKLMSY